VTVLADPPRMGAARDHRGQAYVVTGSLERQRKDRSTATVLEWTSHCADCGAPFTFTTPAASGKFEPNRRCQKHKRPGHRVKEGGNV
jgi:hypothetical protein